MRKILFILMILFYGKAMAETLTFNEEDVYKIQVNGISFLVPNNVKELGSIEQDGKGLFIGVTHLNNLSNPDDLMENSTGMIRVRVSKKQDDYNFEDELDVVVSEWEESGVRIYGLKEAYKSHPLEAGYGIIKKEVGNIVAGQIISTLMTIKLLTHFAETEDKLISVTVTIPWEKDAEDYNKLYTAFQLISSSIN